MKKLIFILLCLTMIEFGQKIYVSDNNLEDWLQEKR